MYDHEKGEWVVEGEALDVDTLFRTRDVLTEQSYIEMRKAGFIPMGTIPSVDIEEIGEGSVFFSFRWKCVPA